MDSLERIKKLKSRRILSLSAGSMMSGIHSSYVEARQDSWELAGQTFIPYPEQLQQSINRLLGGNEPLLSPAEVARLDYALTQLFAECGKAAIAQSMAKHSTPHFIVLNKLMIWKGTVDSSGSARPWNVTLGDAQIIASAINAPVFTDFSRHDIYAGGNGELPFAHGYLHIARRAGELPVFINAGLLSHMTIASRKSNQILFDADIGLGTSLINRVAQTAGVADGFDRDGSFARTGAVDNDMLSMLIKSEVLSSINPKASRPSSFYPIVEDPQFQKMPTANQLATITAATARLIYESFRRDYAIKDAPDGVWISGGGAYNLALIDFLKAYFGSIPVHSVEELGIAPESCIPLALSLAASAYFDGTYHPPKSTVSPQAQAFATIINP